jgi:hypothetical protein
MFSCRCVVKERDNKNFWLSLIMVPRIGDRVAARHSAVIYRVTDTLFEDGSEDVILVVKEV